MPTVEESFRRLDAAVASGELARLCEEHGLEVVVLFGSALTSAEPGDIDLAVGFSPGARRDLLGVVNALADLVPGDHLDIMDLDRADPVAQRAATDHMRVLFEADPTVAAERAIKAFMLFEDTRWLRRLQQESLVVWEAPR